MRRPNALVPTLLGALWFLILARWGSPEVIACVTVIFGAAALLPEEQQRELERRFRNAIADLGLCNAARIIGMDCADLVRALKGEGARRIGLHHIERLPLANRQKFYWASVSDVGLPREARTAIRMTLDALTSEERTA